MAKHAIDRRGFLAYGLWTGGGLLALGASGYEGYSHLLRPAPAGGSASGGTATSDASPGGYVSRPDLRPPAVSLTRERGWTPAPAEDGSCYFVAPKGLKHGGARQQHGLLILDTDGSPVWFMPSTNHKTWTDLQVRTYHGEPVLTWWEGVGDAGHGNGIGYIANAAYQTIATVRAGNGLAADGHELNVTPRGTALITAYRRAQTDLSAIGGPRNGYVWSGQAQEIDIATGKMLFYWDSLEHVGVDETYAKFHDGTEAHPFDYLHINSVALANDGDLLISARDTWTVYKVSRQTGEVVWRLNGRKSDFEMGPGTHFYWQHHATAQRGNRISVFDDGAGPAEEPSSRGLILNVDPVRKRCTLVKQYVHPSKILAVSQGSVQVLADGRVVVGWGSAPYFSEFLGDGTMVVDGKFTSGLQSYRAFRYPWTGHPSTMPDVAVRSSGSSSTVYVSWNGDNSTRSWRVLAGPSADQLSVVTTVTRAGFETAIRVDAAGPYFAVAALDAQGVLLAQSKVVQA